MRTDSEAELIPDRELMGLARSVLESESFNVEIVEIAEGGIPFLLAENSYFIVGVVATATIRDLIGVEGPAAHDLAERVSAGDAGPKLWDAYLVLLTQELSPDAASVTRDLYQINYDTSRLRRLAHTGVPCTLTGVRTALNPFVRPITLDAPVVSTDPFESMTASLVRRGVDEDLASKAVQVFCQGGDVSDAI